MKVKGLRWYIISLVCLATIINYIDRSALSIMWPAIQGDLGMTQEDYAWIINIFTVFYAIGKFVSGPLYDKIGTKLGFVVSIFFWSLASVLHFFARGAVSLGIFRGVLGVAEAGNWPGAVKNNAEWFPIKERAIAQGLFNAGAAIGSIVAAPTISALFEGYGWRVTFVIAGVLGFVWIIPWLFVNKKKPNKHPWITEEEKAHIHQDTITSVEDNDAQKGAGLLKILRHKESWGVLATRFFVEPIWWLFVFWMPIYLNTEYGFSVKEIGYSAWFPYVGAALGSIAGGWAAKVFMAKKSVDKSRKLVVTIGASIIFLGIVAAILFARSAEVFLGFIFIVLFGFQFVISNLQTIPSDLLSDKSVGSLAGLAGAVGAVSVMIMNWLIPVITKESYTPAFIILAVLAPLCVIALHVLIKEIKPIDIS
ncbi:MFS transporter [Spongiimicrobium salis]|uniref:MFS transporter n=1 Tax=Spongiimicrobium salis TaxID=1667022 RepID=UPI00374CF46C